MSTYKTWNAQTKKIARFIREVVLGMEINPSARVELSDVVFTRNQNH